MAGTECARDHGPGQGRGFLRTGSRPPRHDPTMRLAAMPRAPGRPGPGRLPPEHLAPGPRPLLPVLAFPALVATLTLLAGCGGGDPSARAADRPPEVGSLVEEVRIGSADGVDDTLSQVGIVLPLPGGGVWFIEGSERLIRVVDAEGRLTDRVGRQGQGPGEFMIPARLGWWEGSRDTVWVTDPGTRRISLFATDGTFGRTLAMNPVELNPNQTVSQIMGIGTGEVGLGLAAYRSGVSEWGHFPLVRFELETGANPTELLTLARAATVRIRFRGEVVATGAHPMPDSPLAGVTPSGSRVVVLERWVGEDHGPPELRLTSVDLDGDTLWTRTFGYEPRPVPEAELDSIWDARVESFRSFSTLEGRMTEDEAEEAYRAAMVRPRYRPPIEAVVHDATDRILLLWAAGPGEASEAWLLDPEGTPLLAIPVPAGQRVHAFQEDHVWLVEHDAVGIPYLIRSRFVTP